MSKYSGIKSRAVVVVCFTVLSIISGIASCGGSIPPSGPQSSGAAPNIYVSASPSLIAYGAASTTSVITWTSLVGDCTSSPLGIKGASGTFTTPSLTKTTTYTITCGSEKKKVTISLAPASVVTAITAQQTFCENEVHRGTRYYYCDCGKGADQNCVHGEDGSNDGTDWNYPRRTITDAIKKYAGLTGINSIEFCKGGAFDAETNLYVSTNTSCTTGTCTDFREYASPKFTSTAKPTFNSALKGATLFTVGGGRGGIRFLNLRLHGTGIAGNDGIFFYSGAHDVMACNLDIEGFSMGVDQNPGASVAVPPNPRITITGNNFTNNVRDAYFGGGPSAEISNNSMINNGSGNLLDHTIYLSSQHYDALNMVVSGNYMRGQIGDLCDGVMLVGHGRIIGMKITNNYMEIDETASDPGCYGISLDSGGYLSQTNFSNTEISRNTVINTGYVGIAASNCANCLIENNVITSNTASYIGITVGSYVSRSLYSDAINDSNTIRNNTIWFGPGNTKGMSGIQIRNEGAGHIVANNTVNYTSTSANNGAYCFDYTPLASYAFIDYNHCYSNVASYLWEKNSTPGFDAHSNKTNNPPNFMNTIPYEFHPDTGSPLLGTGDTTHAPANDITGILFSPRSTIGAYE